MNLLVERAQTEQRDLNDAESSTFDERRQQLETANKQLERVEFLQSQERSQPVQRRGNDGDFKTQCRSFSLMDMIADRIEPGSRDVGRNKEISAELARRDNG